MYHANPAQPAYVSDFTHMLAFMNQNQARFQEQITRAIALLTGTQDSVPDPQAAQGGSCVTLISSMDIMRKLFLSCPKFNASSSSILLVFLMTIIKFYLLRCI